MSITNDREYEQLKAKLPVMTFLQKYLPEGKKVGNEWVSINPTRADNKAGSFKVNIDEGVWADFATGNKGGDLISLYAYLHRCPQAKAYDDLSQIYHNAKVIPQISKKTTNNEINKESTILFYPAPSDAPEFIPPIDTTYLFEYKDAEGNRLMYVTRKGDKEGKKTKPWTYRNINNENKWLWFGPDTPVKPVFNLQDLLDKPNARVLILEGEKTALAASRLLPDWVCITWQGGANAAGNMDLTYLKNRDIVLWPDNDLNGFKAMQTLNQNLLKITANVKVIKKDWLQSKPEKWDLEDGEKEGITNLDIMELINKLDETKSITIFPVLSPKNGKILNLPENIEHALSFYEVTLEFNEITKKIDAYLPNTNFSSTNKEQLISSEIKRLCIMQEVPISEIETWILYIADKYRYNPVKKWVQSIPWDGVIRFQDFAETLQCTDNDLRNTLLKTWMIGALSVAYEEKGKALHGVLTLLGETSIGKSSWIKKLVPNDLNLMVCDFSLNPNDKDLVMQATGNWLTELSEVDAMVRKADVASIKAFLTRDMDVYRAPYARGETRAPRRTAFLASVNDENFLQDITGNRRWWVLETLSTDYEHEFNMQQVWAEIEHYMLEGQLSYLTREQEAVLNVSNQNYMFINTIHEQLIKKFDWDAPDYDWRFKTCTEVLQMIGYDKPLDKDLKQLVSALKQLNVQKGKPKSIERYHKLMPPLAKEAIKEFMNNGWN